MKGPKTIMAAMVVKLVVNGLKIKIKQHKLEPKVNYTITKITKI